MTAPLIGRTNLARALDAAIGARDHPAVVLRGPAGSGKTVLAEAAVNAALTRGALTGSGKYAEGDTPSPYDPIMRALSVAVGRALDRMHDPEPVMAAMAETLGSALAILTHTGFRADTTPAQSASPAVIGRREGAARVIDAVLRLARWLASFERPIVLLIDDWRRGGVDAHALLGALSSEGVELRLTLVLTERDEASFDYPADESFIGRAIAFPIEVGGLAWEDRRALLDTILGEAGETVFEWLGPDCPALPFDLIAVARELKASDAVRLENGRWLLDPVRAATLGREDLARSLAARLDGLCPDAGRIALGAALWGDGAPAPTLLEAIELAPAAFEAAFDKVAALGLLRRQGEEICFVHDRLRSAVLARGESAIPALAVQMSERLARRPAGTWAAVAAPALRLRKAAGITGAEAETWRDRFAQGSREARARMEVDTANDFAECAWRLRQVAAPEDPAADRLIVREALLAAADRSDAATVLLRIEALLGARASAAEIGADYELAVAALRLAGEPALAWKVACEGLARFGLSPPSAVSARNLMTSVVLWRLDRLVRPRPRATAVAGAPVDGFTRIANAAAALAFERNPRMAAWLALQGSRRASGEAMRSPFWLATDTFLCAMTGDLTEAARLGELAAAAANAPDYNGFARAATLYRALGWGVVWRRPCASLRPVFQDTSTLAIAEGDLVQAAAGIRNWVVLGWRSSPSLIELERETRQAGREAERLGDRDVLAGIAAVQAAIAGLVDPAGGEDDAAEARASEDRPAWARGIPADGLMVTLDWQVCMATGRGPGPSPNVTGVFAATWTAIHAASTGGFMKISPA